MRPNEVDLALHLVNDQLIDADGGRCGRVDDIELSGGVGKATRVAALLVGTAAWPARLPAPFAAALRGFVPGAMYRVDWEAVQDVTTTVKLSRMAAELHLGTKDGRNVRWVNEPAQGWLRLSSVLGLPVVRERGARWAASKTSCGADSRRAGRARRRALGGHRASRRQGRHHPAARSHKRTTARAASRCRAAVQPHRLEPRNRDQVDRVAGRRLTCPMRASPTVRALSLRASAPRLLGAMKRRSSHDMTSDKFRAACRCESGPRGFRKSPSPPLRRRRQSRRRRAQLRWCPISPSVQRRF
jgi:hypothetical protein